MFSCSTGSDHTKDVGKLVNGKREGQWKIYDEHGVLREINYYKNGKLNGPQITFDSAGNVFTRANRFEDKFVDSFKLFYANGQIKTENWFDSVGRSQGVYKAYHDNGKLSLIGRDVDNNSVDTTWGYDEDGELNYFEYYGKNSSRTIVYLDRSKKPVLVQNYIKDSLISERRL
jgi:antitoxin component YwqK of YwqJK toxin-antitoxin module